MIHIQLSNPTHPYSPTSLLTGRVLSPSPSPLPTEILFSGRAKTKIARSNGQSETVYRGRTPLLHIPCPLTFRQEGQVWVADFTIRIPPQYTNVGFPKGYWHIFTPSGPFPGTAQPHDLPPSYVFRNSYKWTGSRMRGFVEYNLTCGQAAPVPVWMHPAAPDAVVPLLNDPLDFAQERNSVASLRLLPQNAERELGIRESLRQVFKPASLPHFGFKMIMSGPRILCAGEPFVVKVGVEAQPAERRDLEHDPEVRLLAVEAHLKTHAVTRAHVGLLGDTSMSSNGECWVQVKPVGLALDTTGAEAREVAFTVRGNEDPSFSTVNLSLQHSLKLKATVSCADKEIVMKRTYTIAVYGRKGGDQADAGVPGYEWVAPVLEDDDDEAAPPPYVEGAGDNVHVRRDSKRAAKK